VYGDVQLSFASLIYETLESGRTASTQQVYVPSTRDTRARATRQTCRALLPYLCRDVGSSAAFGVVIVWVARRVGGLGAAPVHNVWWRGGIAPP
jgi:hypothetical protein